MTEINLLNIADVIKAAKVSKFKINQDRKLGLLRAVKLGKCVRFRPSDVAAWMSGTTAPAPRPVLVDQKMRAAGPDN
jgi:predicted DNA-binding transcriptional regulator AlpA